MEQQNEFLVVFAVVGILFLVLMQYIYSTYRVKETLGKESSNLSLFIALAAFAFVIRIAIAYALPGYETDVSCFRAWAEYSYTGGYADFYNGDFFADYPPLYIYVLSFLGFIRNATGIDVGSPEFGLIVKLPSLMMDIVLAYVVYHVAKQEINQKAGLFLSLLILFNPAVMMNSAVWGQVDIWVTVMMLLVVWMLYKEKLVWAAALFMVAFLLKPQAIMIAPVLLFVFVRNIIVSKDKLKAVFILSGSIGIMFLLFFVLPLPFGIDKQPFWLVSRLMETMGQYPQATLNAMNIYALAGLNFVDASNYSLFGLGLNVWGFIFIGVVCVYALWLYIKRPDGRFLFALSAFILLGVFAFAHGMHERYLYVVPVFMLFAYILMRDRRLFTCTLLVFGVSLLNQVVSLYYYQQYIPDPLTRVLAAISIAVFAYTFYVITMLALTPPEPSKDLPPQKLPENWQPPEKLRLDNFQTKKHIVRKDVLFMVVISAVYACVAFTNLGATQIPQTSTVLDSQNEIVFDFGQTEEVGRIKYYTSFGSSDFEVQYSNDNVIYATAPLIDDGETYYEVEHGFDKLYKWQTYDTDFFGRYVRLVARTGALPILEIAFYDIYGNRLEPQAVSGGAQNLLDEQSLVPEIDDYMTEFYFDELYHVRTAYENIHGITPYEITHPPLGKIIIALGIQIFGMNPFGWRVMGTLAGVLMLPVIYILAKLLLKKTKYAAFAAILFAADFMHFTQTRIGTIDSYSVLWIMLMYLFMYMYTQTNFNVQGVKKTLLPLFLCGLFFGIGAATKWLCIYAGLGLLAIFVITMFKRWKEYRYAAKNGTHPDVVANYKKNLWITLGASVGFFILIPGVIYLVSYTPYFMVTDGGAYTGLADILGNQSYMLNYHSFLDPEYVHPFSSAWYSWPVDIRPVLFFSQKNVEAGTVSTLSTMGNPLIWWTGLVAVAFLILKALQDAKNRNAVLGFLAIAALSQYMPWWFITRELFIYHYFATVPFLILLLVYWLGYMEKQYKYGRIFGFVFVAASVAFFAFFYPVISGVLADETYVEGLRWLNSWPFY